MIFREESVLKLKQDEINFHEGKRLFREHIEPSKVVPVIRKKIAETLKKVYEEEVQIENVGYPENCFVFYFPADAHFLPIFEKELFHILFEMRKNQSSDTKIQIDDYDLMTLDPSYPNMIGTLSTGHKIRGETLSEHELRHAQADQELFHTNSYISIYLKKVVDGQKIVLKISGYALPQHQDTDVEKTIDSLMEPRNPGKIDITRAQTLSRRHDLYAQRTDSIYERFFDVHIKPRLIHTDDGEKPISSEVVAAMALQQWNKLKGLI
ncbi:MAG: hypothetical protein HZA34_01570 [Candidatus Pacebacteria bacterium]|nr:hypothetical protein [Candidatus Paceibacterota bacterium]